MIARLSRWLWDFTSWAAPIIFIAASIAALVVVATSLITTDTPIGNDFYAYRDAAERLHSGGSPYLYDLLNGASSTADPGAYLYPPFLAQLLVPFLALSRDVGYLAFTLLGLTVFALSILFVVQGTGGRVTIRGALLCGSTALWLIPFHSVLYNGNLGLFLGACVALSIIGSPLLAGVVGGLLKVVPGALVLMARPRDISRRTMLAVILILSASVLLSPSAWQTYLFKALPATIVNNDPVGDGGNLAALARRAGTVAELRSNEGAAETAAEQGIVRQAGWTKFLPSEVLRWLGSVERPLRLAGLLLAAALLLLGLLATRDPRRRHVAAAYLTVGGILLPWTIWEHYLVILFPIAVVAWRLGDMRARWSIIAGLLLLTPFALLAFGPLFCLIPSMLLLLNGIRQTRLPEAPPLTR